MTTTKPVKSLCKKLFNSCGGDPHLEMPILHKRNISGFFTDHDDVSIGHGTFIPIAARCLNPKLREYSWYRKPAKYRAAKILLSAILITAPSCSGEFLKKIFSATPPIRSNGSTRPFARNYTTRNSGTTRSKHPFCFRKVITGLHDSGGDLIFIEVLVKPLQVKYVLQVIFTT